MNPFDKKTNPFDSTTNGNSYLKKFVETSVPNTPLKVETTPYSMQETLKPLTSQVPSMVKDVANQQVKNYQGTQGEFEKFGQQVKQVTAPLENAIRQPLQIVKQVQEVPKRILNIPEVKNTMVEIARRTSWNGITSTIAAANSDITFSQAYDALRQSQAGDPSKLNQLWYQLRNSAPQVTLGVALNFVPFFGRPLSAAYWTALSASDQIEKTGSVESLTPIAIDVAGDRMLGSAMEGLFKAPAKTLVKTMSQSFGIEGGTEVAQDLLKYQDAYVRAQTPEEKAQILKDAKEYFTSGQILITGLVGGITGAGVGAGAHMLNGQTPTSAQVSVPPIMEPPPPPPDLPPPPPPGPPEDGAVNEFTLISNVIRSVN